MQSLEGDKLTEYRYRICGHAEAMEKGIGFLPGQKRKLIHDKIKLELKGGTGRETDWNSNVGTGRRI